MGHKFKAWNAKSGMQNLGGIAVGSVADCGSIAHQNSGKSTKGSEHGRLPGLFVQRGSLREQVQRHFQIDKLAQRLRWAILLPAVLSGQRFITEEVRPCCEKVTEPQMACGLY